VFVSTIAIEENRQLLTFTQTLTDRASEAMYFSIVARTDKTTAIGMKFGFLHDISVLYDRLKF